MRGKERDDLIFNNKNLIYVIAKKYTKLSMEWEDLVAYGMVGLVHAANNFDKSKGLFKDYAAICIDGTIMRAIRDYSGWIGTARNRSKGDCIKPINFTSISNPKDKCNNKSDGDRYNSFLKTYSDNSCDTVESNLLLESMLSVLNEREQYVAKRLMMGDTKSEISRTLGVTPQLLTWINHNIQRKLMEGFRDECSRYAKTY